ncbi:hypothetical protein Tsubulata_047436, partial [Turnera subulata]
GDLGNFIPIVRTRTLVSHLDLSTTLIFTTLYNTSTGVLFWILMPVQPMKSIAFVAVFELPHLIVTQIVTAGASTVATLLSFTFTAIKHVRYNQNFGGC